MNGEAHKASHQRAVDADELKVAADGGLDTVGNGPRVPATHRVRDDAHQFVAVIRHDADDGPPRVLVERALQGRITIDGLADMPRRLPALPGERLLRVSESGRS